MRNIKAGIMAAAMAGSLFAGSQNKERVNPLQGTPTVVSLTKEQVRLLCKQNPDFISQFGDEKARATLAEYFKEQRRGVAAVRGTDAKSGRGVKSELKPSVPKPTTPKPEAPTKKKEAVGKVGAGLVDSKVVAGVEGRTASSSTQAGVAGVPNGDVAAGDGKRSKLETKPSSKPTNWGAMAKWGFGVLGAASLGVLANSKKGRSLLKGGKKLLTRREQPKEVNHNFVEEKLQPFNKNPHLQSKDGELIRIELPEFFQANLRGDMTREDIAEGGIKYVGRKDSDKRTDTIEFKSNGEIVIIQKYDSEEHAAIHIYIHSNFDVERFSEDNMNDKTVILANNKNRVLCQRYGGGTCRDGKEYHQGEEVATWDNRGNRAEVPHVILPQEWQMLSGLSLALGAFEQKREKGNILRKFVYGPKKGKKEIDLAGAKVMSGEGKIKIILVDGRGITVDEAAKTFMMVNSGNIEFQSFTDGACVTSIEDGKKEFHFSGGRVVKEYGRHEYDSEKKIHTFYGGKEYDGDKLVATYSDSGTRILSKGVKEEYNTLTFELQNRLGNLRLKGYGAKFVGNTFVFANFSYPWAPSTTWSQAGEMLTLSDKGKTTILTINCSTGTYVFEQKLLGNKYESQEDGTTTVCTRDAGVYDVSTEAKVESNHLLLSDTGYCIKCESGVETDGDGTVLANWANWTRTGVSSDDPSIGEGAATTPRS